MSAGALLLAVLSLGGCGDVVDAAADAGRADASTDANVDPCSSEEIRLEHFFECLRPAYCSAFDCIGFNIPFCYGEGGGFGEIEQVASFVAAGTVVYDGRLAAQCISDLANFCRNGSDPFSEGGPCEAMFTGTLTDGQPCYSDEECGGAGSCNGASCNDQCCLGVCTQSDRPLYADCSVGDCNAGLYCVDHPAGSSSCQTGQIGAPCENSRDCDPRNYCTEENSMMLGTCAADVQENDACTSDFECPAPLHCVGNDLTIGMGTCKRVDQEGAECDSDSAFSYLRGCLGDFYCLGATADVLGACTALPGEGESCAMSKRCNSNTLYCDGMEMCVQRAASGAACSGSIPCQPGFYCNDANICSAPLDNGESCGSTFECKSLVCAGPDGMTTCQAFDACYE